MVPTISMVGTIRTQQRTNHHHALADTITLPAATAASVHPPTLHQQTLDMEGGIW